MTDKKKIDMMKSLHVSELFSMVKDGDDDAVQFLVEMQQAGRHLRYYPEGRSSTGGFGAVITTMTSNEGCIEIRNGRPRSPFCLSMESCFSWIIEIPNAIRRSLMYLQLQGTRACDTQVQMDLMADEGIEFDIDEPDEWDGDLTVTMHPKGASRWRLGYYDSALLLSDLCQSCKNMGWEYQDEIGDEELERIASIIRNINEY